MKEITWNATALSHLDPRTKMCEQEVQQIIHLQNVTNQLPNAFTNTKKVTKSHIPAANAPARIEIPIGFPEASITSESTTRRKRGRPLGSKDLKPRKAKSQKVIVGGATMDHENDDKGKDIKNENTSTEGNILDKNNDIDNFEISINYVSTCTQWNRKDVIVYDVFAYSVDSNIVIEDDDFEPKSVDECQRRKDWPKWKEAIQAVLKSLEKREVFGPVIRTPNGVKPIAYKWVFVCK